MSIMIIFIFVLKVNEKYIRWSQLNIFMSLESKLIVKRIIFQEKLTTLARAMWEIKTPPTTIFHSLSIALSLSL